MRDVANTPHPAFCYNRRMSSLATTSTILKEMGITRPALLLDQAQAQHNLDRLIARIAAAGVQFRPHFKTHQSANVGEWFRARGVTAITTSSLSMARYFADHGWQDITVAVPLNILEMETVRELAGRIQLNLLVDSLPAVAALASGLAADDVRVWIEVDPGYGRSGVRPGQAALALSLAQAISAIEHAHFAGLLTHAGQTYTARTPAMVRKLHDEAMVRLQTVQQHLNQNGFTPCPLSVGDTPAASILDSFPGVAEIRPGNFIFYDLMQAQIGACDSSDIAVAVACPVIGKYPQEQRVVIHGGAVHLSKEGLVEPGRTVFGYPTIIQNGSFGPAITTAPLISLSQEHGVLQFEDADLWDQIDIGDLVAIFPVHSCLTANLHPAYLTLTGEHLPIWQPDTGHI